MTNQQVGAPPARRRGGATWWGLGLLLVLAAGTSLAATEKESPAAAREAKDQALRDRRAEEKLRAELQEAEKSAANVRKLAPTPEETAALIKKAEELANQRIAESTRELAKLAKKVEPNRKDDELTRQLAAWEATQAFYQAFLGKTAAQQQIRDFQERCTKEKQQGPEAVAQLGKLNQQCLASEAQYKSRLDQYKVLTGRDLQDPIEEVLFGRSLAQQKKAKEDKGAKGDKSGNADPGKAADQPEG